MARKKKKDIYFGGWLVAAGCFIRIIQLFGAFFGAGFVSNRWLYATMLCLLCGGFAIISYEKKGRASLFAIVTAAFSLLSTVMSNMSSGADGLRIASAIFLVLTFACAGLVSMFSAGKSNIKLLGGAALLLLAIACGAFAFGISVAPIVILLVLLMAYVLMGAMMII